MKIGFDAPRILDFDVEARPLGWIGGDYVHKETTAIAWVWVDGDVGYEDVEVAMLTKRDRDPARILRAFRQAYDKADIVTGHYIRGFDLPLLNAMMEEFDLGPLSPKMSHDTKLDRLKTHGKSSSQENLGAEYGLNAPKIKMTTADWRLANRLDPRGLEKVRERVVGDVLQHVQLRAEMLRRGHLGKPRIWDPGSSTFGNGDYTP